MPKIEKIIRIDITPERFVQVCTPQEFLELLIEVDRRLNSEANKEHMIVKKLNTATS